MKEVAYKNNHGLIEVYGRTGDASDHGYAHKDATRVGLHITDYSSESLRSASLPMTPNMARIVAERMLEWADAIESNGGNNV